MYFCIMNIQSVSILFLYGFVFSWLAVPRIAQIVRKYKIFRKPSDRDLHWRFVPKLTGLSFYIAFLLIAFVFFEYVDVKRLFLFLAGGALIIYVGIRDDIYELNPFVKLSLQLLAIGLFVFVDGLVVKNLYGFLGIYSLPTGLDYLFTFFIGVFMINSFNLCDGIDGLATGTSAIIGLVLAIFAYVSGNIIFADYLNIMYIPNSGELVIFIAAFVGACVGFLWYNSYPAQVFMGDTGSLAIGGIIAVFAIAIRKELLIPIICGIFLIENVSVLIQVSYFKYTKKKFGEGKRIFLMSPLHHHYQKAGLHESKIVTRFWIVGIMLAILSFVTLKLR